MSYSFIGQKSDVGLRRLKSMWANPAPSGGFSFLFSAFAGSPVCLSSWPPCLHFESPNGSWVLTLHYADFHSCFSLSLLRPLVITLEPAVCLPVTPSQDSPSNKASFLQFQTCTVSCVYAQTVHNETPCPLQLRTHLLFFSQHSVQIALPPESLPPGTLTIPLK